LKRKQKIADRLSGGKFVAVVHIGSVIYAIRGHKVILDGDLAAIYEVSTKRLNEQVRRNRERFPNDFYFQLTPEEWKDIRVLRSQNATLKKSRGKHRKYLPYAFTEHGAIMAATILNTKRAVQMSLFVVRAFIKMRQTMAVNKALLAKLQALEEKLTKRLDSHEQAIVYVLTELRKLMEPAQLPEPKRKPIGFRHEEDKE
jgi:phage regulator Rha-like protein